MSDIVRIEELYQLAIRAFDADQQRLAGCLYCIAKASEEMRLGEVFDLLALYQKGKIVMEPIYEHS